MYAQVTQCAKNFDTVGSNGVELSPSGNKCHLIIGSRKSTSEIPPDSACSDHGNPHLAPLSLGVTAASHRHRHATVHRENRRSYLEKPTARRRCWHRSVATRRFPSPGAELSRT